MRDIYHPVFQVEHVHAMLRVFKLRCERKYLYAPSSANAIQGSQTMHTHVRQQGKHAPLHSLERRHV
jgi:hypothetical protein